MAAELAKTLGVERREMSRCLPHQLAGKVAQNQAYRWSLRTAIPAPRGRSSQPATELTGLMRYYLECIGHDSDKGVSVFAPATTVNHTNCLAICRRSTSRSCAASRWKAPRS